MPLIDIRHKHNMDHGNACDTVQRIADDLASEYGVNCQWHGDKRMTFRRHGLDGAIEVHDDHVAVVANLGMMLTPLKPRLTREVERLLDEHFPASPHC
ncbi:MAG: polyhydroxyalkanoic acid system family protein [Rhodanobacteraceae bacterium]